MGKGKKGNLTRKASLWLQYTFTFFLVVVSSYSVRQLYFMLHADMGYNTENIVWFDLFPSIRNQGYGAMSSEDVERYFNMVEKACNRAEVYNQRIQQSPLFTNCSFGKRAASLTAEKVTVDDWGVQLKADSPGAEFQGIAEVQLSPEAIKLYGLKLLEGPEPDSERDNYKTYRMYLSRSAKEKLGVKDISQTRIQPKSRL